KDWRMVTGSFSTTFLFHENYLVLDKSQTKHAQDIADYDNIYQEASDIMVTNYIQIYKRESELVTLNHPELLEIDDAKKAYLDSISKYEQILIKPIWKG